MQNYTKLSIISCIVLLFFACSDKSVSDIKSYRVTKGNFSNTISVSGYLEAENSKSIAAPQLWTPLKVLFIVEEGAYIYPGDTVCVLEASELANDFNNSEKELEIAKAEFNKTEQELKLKYLMLESKVKSIETTTRIKQLDSIQQNYVSESDRQIIQLEIKRSTIEREKTLTELKFLKKINESELRKTKLKIDQAENNVNRTREKLNRLVIISHEQGLVQLGTNWQTGKKILEGDGVWGNQPLVNLPDLSKLQVKLIVSENHYKRIAPNQKVNIMVDVNPDIEISGIVTRKAPAGKAIIEESNVKVYDVFVSVDSMKASLTPGLSVSCDVFLEELKDTITVPVTAIYQTDTLSYVMKMQNKKLIKTPVTTSNQSDTEVVITEGLQKGDIISINYTTNLN